MSTPYRVGGIVKVKGTLINVPTLYEVLSKIEAIEEYEIIVTKIDPSDPFSEDVVLIRVACKENQRAELSGIIPEAVRRTLEVTPKLEFVPVDHYAGILRNYKFKKFRDDRPK